MVQAPANANAGFNIQTLVDVGQYFIDDDGDSMLMTATYSFNGVSG